MKKMKRSPLMGAIRLILAIGAICLAAYAVYQKWFRNQKAVCGENPDMGLAEEEDMTFEAPGEIPAGDVIEDSKEN